MTEQQEPLKRTRRARSNSEMTEDRQEIDRSTSQTDRAKAMAMRAGDRGPRKSMQGGFRLTVPKHLIPDGSHPRWFLDDGNGRIQQALDAYWEHVTDENGVNITRNYKGGTQYLMCLDKEYKKEDDELKLKRHKAIIGQESKLGENEYSPLKRDSALESVISDH